MREKCMIYNMTTAHEGTPWVPTADDFGSRLAMVRHRMGWNAKEAALACGLPAASWREWELRGREPRGLAQVAHQIADRTDCDEYWLITGKTTPLGPTPDGGESAPSRARTEDLRIKSP